MANLWGNGLWASNLWANGLWQGSTSGSGGSMLTTLRNRTNSMASNTNFNVLNVAAATTTQTTQDYKNEYGLGGVVFLNVSSAGGSITLKVQGKDLTSGTYYDVLAGAAVTVTGLTRYEIFPGSAGTANVSANDVFPFTWRIVVTANNANPMSYSVGVTLVG